jgi:hypothetical protein
MAKPIMLNFLSNASVKWTGERRPKKLLLNLDNLEKWENAAFLFLLAGI